MHCIRGRFGSYQALAHIGLVPSAVTLAQFEEEKKFVKEEKYGLEHQRNTIAQFEGQEEKRLCTALEGALNPIGL